MGIGASQQAHLCDECYACELSPLARRELRRWAQANIR